MYIYVYAIKLESDQCAYNYKKEDRKEEIISKKGAPICMYVYVYMCVCVRKK